MFISDEIIYIQMQKTGCTHIAEQLSGFFKGEHVGKHNPATPAQIESDYYFISSIRNPWDWYLSLWTYGVLGKGRLREQLTERKILSSLKATAKHPCSPHHDLMHELSKDVKVWTELYTRSEDVEAFRKWIKRVIDPGFSKSLGEGYHKSGVSKYCGFMTYRYFYLCCNNLKTLKEGGAISSQKDLALFDEDNCYIDFFIKQESLTDDLCEVIRKIRGLSFEEEKLIRTAEKTNTSKRSFRTSEYYDDEAIEMVLSREKLIINKFDYLFPQ